MKYLVLLFALIISCSVNAQSVVGKWKTIDDETGKVKSHVEIYKQGEKYFGKIIKLTNPKKQNSVCTECTGDNKGKKVNGLVIINNLEKDGDDFSDGTILDPNNGKLYDCTIWINEAGDLQLRGYIGFFFRTQTWKKL
jgi:uncharacterized protein (DUF2147 family)|tara:strand:- start:1698 stop:2111 length:414 start_codon:yes stop_codon:yes gene_type:complete